MGDKMPVGEWIEVYGDGQWMRILTKCKGNKRMFGETTDGYDVTVNNNLEWRYPIDPNRAIIDKIISEWHGINIDNTCEYIHSLVAVETFVRWLIYSGYIEVKK